MPRTVRVPSYRLHKQSGQAIVTLTFGFGRRKDVLLGSYGSPASRAEYARVLAEWQTAGGQAPRARHLDLTVNEIAVRFLDHAELHYRRPDGSPTGETDHFKLSLRPLRELYGHTRGADFGPLALKAVREKMVAAGLCRNVVNSRVGRLKAVFKWAAAEELVPVAVHTALATVARLARGRTAARETDPVKPVAAEHVEAVRPHVRPTVWAMIRLQQLTGMRPGEVCQIRPCELDTAQPIWVYRPAAHKTAFPILDGLDHPNILRVFEFKDHGFGPLLTFQHHPYAARSNTSSATVAEKRRPRSGSRYSANSRTACVRTTPGKSSSAGSRRRACWS